MEMRTRPTLRILIAEDVPSDADLAVILLRRDGLEFEYKVVQTQKTFREALRSFEPHLIISDYSMPGFSGMEALRETRSYDSFLPFILYTGSINEETAVKCIKAGANDYVIKEHMTRLPIAVKEALDQQRIFKEKQISETLLRENQAKFQSLLAAAPGGVGVVINRIFAEVNDTFCRITGYSEEELIGRDSLIIYPSKEEYEYVGREKYRQISLTGTGAVETRIKRKDGVILNVVMSSSAIDPADLSKGATFIVLDVTNLKYTESELRKMSTVVEQNPISIIITDVEGSIEYVNPRFCEITGYNREEVSGKNPRFLASGEMKEEVYALMWSTIKSGNVWKGEFKNRRKSGQIYWESASISPIVDEKGTITHFVGIKEDITTRKKSEQVQRALYKISGEVVVSNDFENLIEVIYNEISLVFNSQNFYIAFYDTHSGMLRTLHSMDEKDELSEWPAERSLTGHIIKTNSAMLVRRPEVEEMISKGVIDQVGTPSAIWLGVPMSTEGKVDGALVIQDYQNPDAFDYSDLELLKFIAGQISLSLQRQQSLTDLKNALRLAEASDRLKSSFLNNISHEVRTPLNGILGFAQFLVQPDITEAEKKEYLNILNASSERLLNTITGYMDISLLASGNQKVNPERMVLNMLIDRIYLKYLPAARMKNIDFSVRVPEGQEFLELYTDRILLEKALSHLIDNAVKFTQKGTVELGYEVVSRELVITVSDTGEGISDEGMVHIFEYFSQADGNITKKYDGSGLGLSIVKAITDLLGGEVMVQSEPGSGSLFSVRFPLSHISAR
jgi:PAS domain S-box-containing protein